MIGHKLPNKTKSATVAEPNLFHPLNNPDMLKLKSEDLHDAKAEHFHF
jgi:hypothetical protein